VAPGTLAAIISGVVLFSFRASRGKIASADILLERRNALGLISAESRRR